MLYLSSLALCSFFLAAFFSSIGTYCYRILSKNRGILAHSDYRSLHEGQTPSGGGLIFSAVFLFGMVFFYFFSWVDIRLLVAITLGGGITVFVGFIDDFIGLRQSTKLAIQGILSAGILYYFYEAEIWETSIFFKYAVVPVIWLALVWLMNLYNFIDGADAMAASAAVYISLAASLAIMLKKGETSDIVVFLLLASCVVGFLFFNWPRASIFMGDTGSLFLGFLFSLLSVYTIINDNISIWTWLIIFGYYGIDTTVTLMLRVVRVGKFYRPHRSHAYQNLVRVSGSHSKILYGVLAYDFFWLLPLVVWSVVVPKYALLAFALAVTPSTIFTLRYGPLMSSD